MNDDFDGIMPVMPVQCGCGRWVELNDTRRCYDCHDDTLRCKTCAREHKAEHVDEDEEAGGDPMTDKSTWRHPLVDPEDPCQDLRCTRLSGRCVSIHCVVCGQSCGIYGHPACLERGVVEEAGGDQ